MKKREEVLAEIEKAISINKDAKSMCNIALSDASSLLICNEKETQEKIVKEYQRGLNDAWEIVKELNKFNDEKGVGEIFGYATVMNVINAYSPQKIKQIIESYREEELKRKIVVGDVVSFEDGTKGIVMDEDGENIAIFTENGCFEAWTKKENVTKVDGKHIEISNILKQI